MRVEWPPEGQRQILTLRVVAAGEERISGRALRQALAAGGFIHGKFAIYHQPAADGRAVISAANLSQPGTFDPTNMDFQRVAGVSVFAVLPGPLAPAATVRGLVDAARDLAGRLQGRVLDEHGKVVDAATIAAMQHAVENLTAMPARADQGP